MTDALIMTGATLEEVLPLIIEHHYTHRRTADPMHCFAWREPGGLLGDTGLPQAAIVYAAPTNRYFGKNSVELVRLVRLPGFSHQLSEFVCWSLRWLKQNTKLNFALAYADQGAGHHGGVYQASNLIYVNNTAGNRQYQNEATGEIVSGRAFDQRRSGYRVGWRPLRTAKKYLYIAPLNEDADSLLNRFDWRRLPYPKPDIR